MISDLQDKLKKFWKWRTTNRVTKIRSLGFETSIQDKEAEKEELDYRNAHASAGYVYIISNIGAFGADVVKIGVTRRLEPVRTYCWIEQCFCTFFKFDVHALIFSYEAYQLVPDLHKHFDKQKN